MRWNEIFKLSFIVVRETKIESFQYRILHRTITCRKRLHEMRLVESPLCTVCQCLDDLSHFFFYCNYVSNFWNSIISWINSVLNSSISLNEFDILFGLTGSDDASTVMNFLILHAKFFIHRQRIQDIHELHIIAFKNQLKVKLTIEKIICEREKPWKFAKFQPLLNSL